MPKDALLCGPLLRYTYIDHDKALWHGSALVVLAGDTSFPPTLLLDAADERVQPLALLSERGSTFWRFSLEVQLEEKEKKVGYRISGGTLERELEHAFWVPGKDDSMRIMFCSCNGYDDEANPDDFAGPVLWKNVMNIHASRPFHVQIGGGDQVYSDGVRTEGGPLEEWADQLKPKAKAAMPCPPEFELVLEEWYFKNYCEWYTHPEIAPPLASIPAVNIWDDHDIVDGFGSYKDKWMRAPMFLGIGRVAWKYYALFQQQVPPDGEEHEDPSYMLGRSKGPYIKRRSRSICTTLGKRLVFFGLDCRTERTLKRVCHSDTYDDMFKRLDAEVGRAADTTHLILLLGIPIAYPRLVWAERILTSHTIDPIRALHRKLNLTGGLFNHFDGTPELLDDLNDHWCAGTHKKERNYFVRRLQDFATRKNVRVTILGGDVHLAAVGRFFTNAKLKIPQNKDPRYMLNVISSAITNAGPPIAFANVLDRRNKLHRLDALTHENMMDIWFENPDGSKNAMNRTMMPRRNYVIITEHAGLVEDEVSDADGVRDADGAPHAPSVDGTASVDDTSYASSSSYVGGVSDASTTSGAEVESDADSASNPTIDGGLGEKDTAAQADARRAEKPAHDLPPAKKMTGGVDAPSAAAPISGSRRRHALDVVFRVEIDQHDPSGATRAYGFVVPALET